MLQPLMHILNSQRIVLASGSPRRKQILENIGLGVEVIPSTFAEDLDKTQFKTPQDYVLMNAKIKTQVVAERLSAEGNSVPDLIIGADTVVSQDNEIIEKPKDKDDAFRILSKLSGCSHNVYTGVVLFVPSDSSTLEGDQLGAFKHISFVESTAVHMAQISDEIVRAYIETGEPMDKAGGYGIQALGATLVDKIDGDYYNVMGFPLTRFAKELTGLYAKLRK